MNPLGILFALLPIAFIAAIYVMAPPPSEGWRIAVGVVGAICWILVSVARLCGNRDSSSLRSSE